MRKCNEDCLILCRIQGNIFKKSLDILKCSSPLFIKKYMNGIDALSMDNLDFLNTSKSDIQVLLDIKDTEFGTVKYSGEDMYWMGYLYRYWTYTYEINSKQLFKLFPGTKLINYSGYNNHDPKYTINMIIEDNNLKMPSGEDLFVRTKELINKQLDTLKFTV